MDQLIIEVQQAVQNKQHPLLEKDSATIVDVLQNYYHLETKEISKDLQYRIFLLLTTNQQIYQGLTWIEAFVLVHLVLEKVKNSIDLVAFYKLCSTLIFDTLDELKQFMQMFDSYYSSLEKHQTKSPEYIMLLVLMKHIIKFYDSWDFYTMVHHRYATVSNFWDKLVNCYCMIWSQKFMIADRVMLYHWIENVETKEDFDNVIQLLGQYRLKYYWIIFLVHYILLFKQNPQQITLVTAKRHENVHSEETITLMIQGANFLLETVRPLQHFERLIFVIPYEVTLGIEGLQRVVLHEHQNYFAYRYDFGQQWLDSIPKNLLSDVIQYFSAHPDNYSHVDQNTMIEWLQMLQQNQ